MMGQSHMEKIENNLLDLREGNDVDEEQAKNFLLDYMRTGQKTNDVSKYLENPSMQLFLQHFIQRKYPSHDKKQ